LHDISFEICIALQLSLLIVVNATGFLDNYKTFLILLIFRHLLLRFSASEGPEPNNGGLLLRFSASEGPEPNNGGTGFVVALGRF